MTIKKSRFFLVISLIIIFIYYILNKIQSSDNLPDLDEFKSSVPREKKTPFYYENCAELYKKLRYPNQSLVFRPPLLKPPADMYADFVQYGKMPIKKYWYINEAYSDSNGSEKEKNIDVISSEFDEFLRKIRRNEKLNYKDKVLNKIMHEYSHQLKDKTIAVIGTQIPWVEAIAYEIGASHITTLEYTRKKYERQRLEWLHVNDYLDEALKKLKFEHYDNIVSFSSIEHSGLGRYGDPLSPYGDLDAVRQAHCMLKPGGLFFLAIPVSKDDSSYIEFNAHRIYGSARLKLLFSGWQLLHKERDTMKMHGIFVLRKI